MKQCISLLLCMTATFCYGQDSNACNKAVFKIAPLSFVDNISFCTTQAGFEFRITHKYSIDFSYGQVFGRELFNQEKGKGFKAKVEIRRYFQFTQSMKHKYYFALEGYSHKLDYSTKDKFRSNIDSTVYQESYNIKKDVFGFNVKIGFETTINKSFLLDVYGGLGARVKDAEHINRTRPEDPFYSVDLLGIHIRDQPGYYSFPCLTLGVKIGYIIKR